MSRCRFAFFLSLLTHYRAVVVERLWLAFAVSSILLSNLLSSTAAGAWGLEDAASDDFFESRIRPVLIDKCVGCHGVQKQWASLQLHSSAALGRGGESGSVLAPGEPEKSEIYLRVVSEEDSYRMPPHGEQIPPLTLDEQDAFRRWIEAGAHWPAEKDEVAGPGGMLRAEDSLKKHWAFQPRQVVAVPPVNGEFKNPIDAFIEAKRGIADIAGSPKADGRTLLRRVAFDVTGLPPDLALVMEVGEDIGDEQFERIVDDYLESAAFGEHWARLWLDVARFSDTKGYVYDREERFFVHAALYRDWVVKALNADMPFDRFVKLQIAADRYESESSEHLAAMGFITLGKRFLGVVPDIIDDRIDTVTRGLLGLTVSCARCHDHKYDPISTAEYYSLYRVFSHCHEEMVAAPAPEGTTPEFLENLAGKKKLLNEAFQAAKNEAEDRLRKKIAEYLMAQFELDKYPSLNFNQVVSKDDIYAAVVHRWQAYLFHSEQNREPIFSLWIALSQLAADDFEQSAEALLAQVEASEEKRLPNGVPVHPLVLNSFSNRPKTMREVADRYSELLNQVWDSRSENAEPSEASQSLLAFMDSVDAPCKFPSDHLVNIEWFLDTSTEDGLWRKQGDYERVVLSDPHKVPHYVVLKDIDSQLEGRVFKRGNPATKGEVVPRALPKTLGAASHRKIESGSGRWELAESIVDPTNPLTARVWVNRVWQKYFGAGLVSTPSDFGVRVAPPTHPELLDWLANEFIANGWSNKWLHRTLLTSKVYQQSSFGPSDSKALQNCLASDPENQLLWRMNPKRHSFEVLRDAMLFASSQLDRSVGGKSIPLFTQDDSANRRRTIYGLIDRQYMPGALSVFDVATPDMHTPMRAETTVPQQALFYLNHPFVAARAKGVIQKLEELIQLSNGGAEQSKQALADSEVDRIRGVFRLVLQREPTNEELHDSLDWVRQEEIEEPVAEDLATEAWSYGYGALDPSTGKIKEFKPLPYATQTHWQGGPNLPDPNLGWVHIAADIIHSGDTVDQSAVRRWTSPVDGQFSVQSIAKHWVAEGDGARAIVSSSRHGMFHSEVIHNRAAELNVERLDVQAGDTIDFIVELSGTLNHEDLSWAPVIQWSDGAPKSQSECESGESDKSKASMGADRVDATINRWDARKDFRTSAKPVMLTKWERFAQILLISNESVFVD